MDHRGRVVAGVLSRADGRIDDGCPQHVVRVGIGAPHALVDHVLQTLVGFPFNVHADAHVDHHDTGVLADGPAALGAHARVHQDLRHGVLRRRRLLALIGLAQRTDVIQRMVVRDVLQRVGDALNEIFFLYGGHDVFRH